MLIQILSFLENGEYVRILDVKQDLIFEDTVENLPFHWLVELKSYPIKKIFTTINEDREMPFPEDFPVVCFVLDTDAE